MNLEKNTALDREKKVSLHMLIEPSLKQELIDYANKHGYENTSQAGRAILRKGLDTIEKEK